MESAQPFGSLATHPNAGSAFDGPMALRPRLAAGLPFRGEQASSHGFAAALEPIRSECCVHPQPVNDKTLSHCHRPVKHGGAIFVRFVAIRISGMELALGMGQTRACESSGELIGSCAHRPTQINCQSIANGSLRALEPCLFAAASAISSSEVSSSAAQCHPFVAGKRIPALNVNNGLESMPPMPPHTKLVNGKRD
jgi:hypothetical protein